MDVDLTWNAKNTTWTGMFHRGTLNRPVVLTRPNPEGASAPFSGTWANQDSGALRCLHISQQQNGNASGWLDTIAIPWNIRWGKPQRPKTVLAQYGTVIDVTKVNTEEVIVELNVNSSSGMSTQPLRAVLSADEKSFAAPEFTPEKLTIWTKQATDSCTAGMLLDQSVHH